LDCSVPLLWTVQSKVAKTYYNTYLCVPIRMCFVSWNEALLLVGNEVFANK